VPDVDHIDDDPVDGPADERGSGGGATAMTVVTGIIIGAVIAAGVLWLSSRGDGETAEQLPPPTEPSPDADGTDDPTAIDPVDLVVAYGRSRTENHALTGELRRDGQEPLPVRRAIRNDRSIDEVGDTAAVTENGETRQCERIEGEWLCTSPLPAIGSDIDVQGFATLLLTESPPYSIFAVAPDPPPELASIADLGPTTCWSIVSAGRRDRARFGAETTVCFHDELGALVGRVTETSAGDDLFIATELRSQVTTEDVEPSR
jgi:hypothetical protein